MLEKSLVNYLNNLKIDLKLNEPLRNYTTFDIGGEAKVLAKPRNLRELIAVFSYSLDREEKYFIIGNGSNLLVKDEGFGGVVISLGQGDFLKIEGESRSLRVGAGIKISKLLGFCEKEGMSGIEFLAGIPATLGGAIKQNAGSKDATIANVIKEITYLDKQGKLKTAQRKDLNFSYRKLNLDLAIITEANLKSS